MDRENADKTHPEPLDGFIPHVGDGRPESLPHTQGAIVQLRSGRLALFPPAAKDSLVSLFHYWQQHDDLDDNDDGDPSEFTDIVAYKPLPVTAADELARAALHILQFVSTSLPEGAWLSGHSMSQSSHRFGAIQARKQVLDAVAAYARSWPTDPKLKSLRRLGIWGDDVRYDEYDDHG